MANNYFFMLESIKGEAKNRAANLKPFLLGLAVLLIVLIMLLVGGTVWATRWRLSDRPVVLALARALDIPAARVNDVEIPYVRYIDDTRVLRRLYQAQGESAPAFSKDDISNQVLSRLIINILIEDLADRLQISVSDNEVQPALSNFIGPFASEEEIEKELRDRYGWSKDDYVNNVVRPLILEQKVAAAFSQSAGEEWSEYEAGDQVRARHILFRVEDEKEDKQIKKQAQAVLKRAQTGEDFAALALEFSADPTKDNGGDLGWFPRGAMVKEFEEGVFALEPGQVGKELIKSQFGYHIVKLEERRPFRDLGLWLDEQLRTADIDIFIPVPNPFAGIGEKETETEKIDSAESVTSTAESGNTK